MWLKINEIGYEMTTKSFVPLFNNYSTRPHWIVADKTNRMSTERESVIIS